MASSSEETVTSSEPSSISSLDHGDESEFLVDRFGDQLSIEVDSNQIIAFKDLQNLYNQTESRYLKVVNQLEYEFHERCKYVFERRSAIINGYYEPTDEECQLKTDFNDPMESFQSSSSERGISEFWLYTLKQVPMICELIEEWDEPILKSLKDIELKLQLEPVNGFTLHFHFDENAKKYFSNDTLTKFYEIQIDPDNDDLIYEGAAIVRSLGCNIDWIDKKTNVTIDYLTGVEQRSFFNFFRTISNSESGQIDDAKLTVDFRIGHYIREHLIPKAVLFYTGEIFGEDYDLSDMSDDYSYTMSERTGDGEHL